MLWVNHPDVREAFPGVDFDELAEAYSARNWPPDADEGVRDATAATQTGRRSRERSDVPVEPRLPPLGEHFTEYVNDVRELKRQNRLDDASVLLLALIEATEAESLEKSWGVAPWYYEQLAIVRRKLRDRDGEIAILERFAAQTHAPGISPPKLLARLQTLRDRA